MTDNTEKVNSVPEEEGTAEEIKETEAAETETENAEETKADKGDKKKSKKLEAELEKKEKELAEANDKYMRLFAEYDNFRKRSAKEKEGIYADAYIDALAQILPVLDNLERAAQYSGEDAEHPLAKGLELTLKSFKEVMEKMGVSEIEALGKQFDPNVHNAVMHVDDDSFGENEIVEVFMKGYVKGDKVLRFSMVKVAN
jgi:molecular chaperone GrpE